MARTVLTVQEVVIAGKQLTMTTPDVTDGVGFVNTSGGVMLLINNASAGEITATFATPGKVAGVDIAEHSVAVAAGTMKVVGPFDSSVFNQASGQVYATFSAVTDVTVAAIRLR
jgi:hypothetical protein